MGTGRRNTILGQRSRLALFAVMLATSATVARPESAHDDASAGLVAVADQVLAWRTNEDIQLRLSRGLKIVRFARFSHQEERAYAQRARAFIDALDRLRPGGLSDAEHEFRLALLHDLAGRARADDDYWYDFAVTPYRGGDVHQWAAEAFAQSSIDTVSARKDYLQLIETYAEAVDGMRLKTLAQAERGIRLPRPAIPGALALIDNILAEMPGRIPMSDNKLAAMNAADASIFRSSVEKQLAGRLLPALTALRRIFDEAYVAAAPEAVGLRQYAGGLDRYRRCIRDEIGLDLTPRAIHRIGVQAGREYDERLVALRASLNFKGDRAAFAKAIASDPRWLAGNADELAARYELYLRKIEPLLPNLFLRLPKAPYGVRRLDPSSEGGQTYGTYQSPSARDPKGYYRFNGSDLANRPMIGAQHLIYHELMPGHHLQVALARERPALHPLEAYLSAGSFAEGWAEYAAWLGEEAGLYGPYEMMGHLQLQSFLAARLVADTGMNALGWPLAKARGYMHRYSDESDGQIASETLRYATDIPCQALGYFLGYNLFRKARAKAQSALGRDFDIRRFHDAMLFGSGVPISLINRRAERFIAAELRRGGNRPNRQKG